MRIYILRSWNAFSSLCCPAPVFKSKQGNIFPFIMVVMGLLNKKNTVDSLPLLPVLRERLLLPLEMCAKKSWHPQCSQWKLWRTVTGNAPDQTLSNINQWAQFRQKIWVRSKELLMKHKVDVKKPESHVGSHWNLLEVNWKGGRGWKMEEGFGGLC